MEKCSRANDAQPSVFVALDLKSIAADLPVESWTIGSLHTVCRFNLLSLLAGLAGKVSSGFQCCWCCTCCAKKLDHAVVLLWPVMERSLRSATRVARSARSHFCRLASTEVESPNSGSSSMLSILWISSSVVL